MKIPCRCRSRLERCRSNLHWAECWTGSRGCTTLRTCQSDKCWRPSFCQDQPAVGVQSGAQDIRCNSQWCSRAWRLAKKCAVTALTTLKTVKQAAGIVCHTGRFTYIWSFIRSRSLSRRLKCNRANLQRILQHDSHSWRCESETNDNPYITLTFPFPWPFSAAPYCRSLAFPDLLQSLAAQLPAS